MWVNSAVPHLSLTHVLGESGRPNSFVRHTGGLEITDTKYFLLRLFLVYNNVSHDPYGISGVFPCTTGSLVSVFVSGERFSRSFPTVLETKNLF